MKVAVRTSFKVHRLMQKSKRHKRKVLPEIGYQTRLVARSLIKTKKDKNKASQEGKPPYNHGNLKKSILYGVDGDTSVFIGPAFFKGNPLTNAARINEFGGKRTTSGSRRTYAIGKVGPIDISGWRSSNGRITRDRSGYLTPPPKDGRQIGAPAKGVAFAHLKTNAQVRRAMDIDRAYYGVKTADYPARPYMKVALKRMAPRLMGFWVNAVSS